MHRGMITTFPRFRTLGSVLEHLQFSQYLLHLPAFVADDLYQLSGRTGILIGLGVGIDRLQVKRGVLDGLGLGVDILSSASNRFRWVSTRVRSTLDMISLITFWRGVAFGRSLSVLR